MLDEWLVLNLLFFFLSTFSFFVIFTTGQAKRGRHKAVTTTKQRLAKILKLDKSGRYMR